MSTLPKKPVEDNVARFDNLSRAAAAASKGIRDAFGQYTNRSANNFEKIMRRIHVTIGDLLKAFENFWSKLTQSQEKFTTFAKHIAPPLREAFRQIKAEIDGMGRELRRITRNLTVSKQGFENYVKSIQRVAAALDLLNRAAKGIPLPYLGPRPLDVKPLEVKEEKKEKKRITASPGDGKGGRKGRAKATPEQVVDDSLGFGASIELLTEAVQKLRKAMRAVHSEMNRFGRQLTKLAAKASSISKSFEAIVRSLGNFKNLQAQYNTPFNELAEIFAKLRLNIGKVVPDLRRLKKVLDGIGGSRKTRVCCCNLKFLLRNRCEYGIMRV